MLRLCIALVRGAHAACCRGVVGTPGCTCFDEGAVSQGVHFRAYLSTSGSRQARTCFFCATRAPRVPPSHLSDCDLVYNTTFSDYCMYAWPLSDFFDALRYHSPPRALFGGKLDQSALVESVVLLACRGGLQDQEVRARATMVGHARRHTPYTGVLPAAGPTYPVTRFFSCSFKTRGTGADTRRKFASCFHCWFSSKSRQHVTRSDHDSVQARPVSSRTRAPPPPHKLDWVGRSPSHPSAVAFVVRKCSAHKARRGGPRLCSIDLKIDPLIIFSDLDRKVDSLVKFSDLDRKVDPLVNFSHLDQKVDIPLVNFSGKKKLCPPHSDVPLVSFRFPNRAETPPRCSWITGSTRTWHIRIGTALSTLKRLRKCGPPTSEIAAQSRCSAAPGNKRAALRFFPHPVYRC